jgi:hypothetical protein
VDHRHLVRRHPDTNADADADTNTNTNTNPDANTDTDTNAYPDAFVRHLGRRRDLHGRQSGELSRPVVHRTGNAHGLRGHQLESEGFANAVGHGWQLQHANANANADTYADADTYPNADANANAYPDTYANADANADTDTNRRP